MLVTWRSTIDIYKVLDTDDGEVEIVSSDVLFENKHLIDNIVPSKECGSYFRDILELSVPCKSFLLNQ